MEDKSIFEKILSREISSNIIFESDNVFAIHDINPVAPIHILIIPKKKIPTMNDIEDGDWKLISELVFTAKELAKEYKINDTGYRLIWNTNQDALQTVFHIHLHLIGGKKLSWNF